MRSTTLATLVALAAAPVSAIPPESFGFPSAPNDTALVVAYNYNGNVTVIQEGELLGSGIPEMQPTVAVNEAQYMSLADYNGAYVVMMVDPDASTPQNPTSRFILHWMQPNMYPSNSTSMNSTIPGATLMNMTAPVVPYARPMPPPTSDAHRYILYAFEQPSGFMVPDAFSGYSAMNRSDFNLTNFISAANLGTPAAAMFYFCNNMTNVPNDFIALPGGTYPGGNGGLITAGLSGPATQTGMSASTATAMSGTTTSSGVNTGTLAAPTSGSTAAASTTPAAFDSPASVVTIPGSMVMFFMAVIGAAAFCAV